RNLVLLSSSRRHRFALCSNGFSAPAVSYLRKDWARASSSSADASPGPAALAAADEAGARRRE
ncbi:hypothetical protein, partial [Mesorhizobium sp. M4B.F.Ca.ET.013.02.1.1]|uniref:hypothetical protein n=1 Tax=Mesorhizobium sp. M4B.F.Ca.ET.013.02.1.1 TaxID=2496755 RepID=UPI001AECAC5A